MTIMTLLHGQDTDSGVALEAIAVLCMQVYGLPTLVVFKEGKVLDGSQREGAISEPELRKYLDKWEVSK